MPPRSISSASTADQNAEHQRKEPDHAATPPPPPPPPKDIYATLAGTLASMDAEQYYQSIQRDLPADEATLQGWKQEKRNDNEWKTFSGKTPGKAPWRPSWKRQPKPTPARPGTPGTASTPSEHSTAGNTATPSPSTPSTTIHSDGHLKTTPPPPSPYTKTPITQSSTFDHTLGGDFNCVLDPKLDQHSLVDLHEWHWLMGEVEYLPFRLVDTFRSEHPSLRQYTCYASDRWDSEARLDYIFASPRLVSHFPLLDASVLTDYTISDHHPVVAVFQCPSPILLSQPPLPPYIFWKLSSDEKQQFSKSVQLISDWCRDLKDAPARAPLEEIIAATDSLLMQVGSAYHKITRPKPQRKKQEGYGKLRKLLRSPLPLSSPAFPEHIAEFQSVVNTLRSSDVTKAKRKLHSSLVRGAQVKSTVARTLCPKDLEPLVVRDPATKELLSDPADVAKVYGDTLLHLGGHPDYAPPQDFVEEVLSHSPICPVSAKNDHIPPVTWQEFLNHLKHSKPSKAGGRDKANNYILALCPEPIQQFFHSILSRFFHSPLPPHWLCAKICFLYKKGAPFSPQTTVLLPS